jgi:hypothetical protein
VEADIEIGFCLVDSVEAWPANAHRLVSDAEEVYADAIGRLNRLHPSEREKLQPLITELRRAIDLARRHS